MFDDPAHQPDDIDRLDLAGATMPPEPGEDAWAGVLDRIKSRAAAPKTIRPPHPRRMGWPALWLGSMAATAAALLLAVGIVQWSSPRPGAPEVPAVTIWPVATDDDVEILSMDAGDFLALVVGQPPHRGPLVLATADDVHIDDTGHDVEVRIPEDWKVGQPAAPMIIMPLDPTNGR